MSITALVFTVIAVLIVTVDGIMWKLQPNAQKCLKEELQSDVLVTGDYEVQDAPGQKVDYVKWKSLKWHFCVVEVYRSAMQSYVKHWVIILYHIERCKVRDSKGHILSQKEDISRGKFSFVTENYDTFEICFISRVPPQQRGLAQEVSLVTKRGVEAKNYEGLGEAAKLKPLEVELKRLEDLSDAIVQDFSQMRKREEEMRDTNESTNSRVLYFSIFSMCCLLGLATWQVLYLRRFFKAKKLIE